MVRTVERWCKLTGGRVDQRFQRRVFCPGTHKEQDGISAAICFMTSNQTSGTIDQAGVKQFEPAKPGDPQVGLFRARLYACVQSTLCMVLVAVALRLIVMGFLYQERLDPDRDNW